MLTPWCSGTLLNHASPSSNRLATGQRKACTIIRQRIYLICCPYVHHYQSGTSHHYYRQHYSAHYFGSCEPLGRQGYIHVNFERLLLKRLMQSERLNTLSVNSELLGNTSSFITVLAHFRTVPSNWKVANGSRVSICPADSAQLYLNTSLGFAYGSSGSFVWYTWTPG